jgi:hypothetical protein
MPLDLVPNNFNVVSDAPTLDLLWCKNSKEKNIVRPQNHIHILFHQVHPIRKIKKPLNQQTNLRGSAPLRPFLWIFVSLAEATPWIAI